MIERQDQDQLPEVPAWAPRKGFFAVDEKGKLGVVVGRSPLEVFYLRPPGGGREWEREADQLRPPTEAELRAARVLSTPVGGQ
ncbi:hypothetical protein ACFUT3_30345 [Streptomyces cinereoruber]|uniref:hypothetical protein n=1 Tax=Streptomyces cinereoruber TaxID=67260 RepID=UPI003639012B